MSDSSALSPAPIDKLTAPIRALTRHPLGGAILLVIATLVALVWANSSWADAYHAFISLPVTLTFASFELSNPLEVWVNDGLMGIFFFVVGLEIKREAVEGELASPRKAALPIAAALGGMLVPAGFYALFNAGHAGSHGWGIPMATDIAFTLGALMLLGSRVPVAIKVFLTALAIVDDLGAIVVIAIFYTDHIAVWSLVAGGALIGVSVVMNLLGVRNALAYFLVGSFTWLAFLQSGVHATLAAVLMAFTIPARTRIDSHAFMRNVDALLNRFRNTGVTPSLDMLTDEQQTLLQAVNVEMEHATAPLQRLEHALAPISTFVVLPVFALFNAGIAISGSSLGHAVTDRVALGVVAGLLLGKQVGIVLASWLTVKLGLAQLPSHTSWRDIHGAGVLAGIGFTMSIFITALAFKGDTELIETAKIGILAGSVLSGIAGYLLFRFGKKAPSSADTKVAPNA